MSVAFSSARPRSKGEVTQQTIQKVKGKPNSALMLRFCFECGWECARPLLAQKKVTPVANIGRNGNWYIRAGRRCEGKQSLRRRVFFRSSDASFILQYRCALEILISFGFLSPLCCVPSAVADGHFERLLWPISLFLLVIAPQDGAKLNSASFINKRALPPKDDPIVS